MDALNRIISQMMAQDRSEKPPVMLQTSESFSAKCPMVGELDAETLVIHGGTILNLISPLPRCSSGRRHSSVPQNSHQ